jgi:hypothetical protein
MVLSIDIQSRLVRGASLVPLTAASFRFQALCLMSSALVSSSSRETFDAGASGVI